MGSGLEGERAHRVPAQCWGRSTHGNVAQDRGQQCAGPLPKFLKVSHSEARCLFIPDSKAEKTLITPCCFSTRRSGTWANHTAGDKEPFHKGRYLQIGDKNLNTGLFPNTLPDHGKEPGRVIPVAQQRPVLGHGCVFPCTGTR